MQRARARRASPREAPRARRRPPDRGNAFQDGGQAVGQTATEAEDGSGNRAGHETEHGRGNQQQPIQLAQMPECEQRGAHGDRVGQIERGEAHEHGGDGSPARDSPAHEGSDDQQRPAHAGRRKGLVGVGSQLKQAGEHQPPGFCIARQRREAPFVTLMADHEQQHDEQQNSGRPGPCRTPPAGPRRAITGGRVGSGRHHRGTLLDAGRLGSPQRHTIRGRQ